MDDLREKYDQLVLEEDQLIQKIGVCEGSITAILEYITNKCDSINALIVEDIISSVHTIEKDLQTELLHLKLEKGLLANRIKYMKPN